jgi:nitrite reductase (NADH) small subunit
MSDWIRVAALEDIPRQGARVLQREEGNIAVFRTGADEVFALRDRCPHKGGQLSQGMVFERKVACPLHGRQICLDTGEVVAPDEGCVRAYPVKVEEGLVYLQI